MILVLLLGGLQLICIGILGQYIGRIYEEVKQRPRYILVASRPASRRSTQVVDERGRDCGASTVVDAGLHRPPTTRFRENDDYARAKYDITLRWLGPGARVARLLNVGCGNGTVQRDGARRRLHASRRASPTPSPMRSRRRRAAPGVVVHLGGLFDAPFDRRRPT